MRFSEGMTVTTFSGGAAHRQRKTDSPYGDTFCDAIEGGSLSSAMAIVPIVRSLLPCRSGVDVGCGRGAWLSVFQRLGSEQIRGYDGSDVDQSVLLRPTECVESMDLSRAFSV